MAAGAAIVKSVSGRYRDRAREIQQLVDEMESAWQGNAAGQARRGAGPLLTEHEIASHHFSISEDLTDRQSGSYSRAKNSVVPMPPEPGEVPAWGSASAAEWIPYAQRVEEYKGAAQHNVDVMNVYSGASLYNTDNLPVKYGELADDQAGVTFDQPDTINSEDFRDTRASSGPDDRSVGGARDFGPVGGPGPGDTGPAGRPNVTTPPPIPGQVGPAGTTTPGGFSPGQQPVGTPLPSTDFGQGRPVPTGGAPVAGFGPVGVGGGYPPGLNRGGPGEFGPRGSGPGGGGPAGGALPRGGASGVGAEPHPARANSTFGPAGARGAGAGMGGGMPMGGGRGRGEDDTERKTPTYLEGGDPEDLFGNELLTAPPVIGDDAYEDD
ncbi:hypothetical protein [Actinophytocola sp.]|uniref:hypothetical protein n=1 Tax=Actinophytocola sp. TaxID=1872138 RepID=UPI002ED31064